MGNFSDELSSIMRIRNIGDEGTVGNFSDELSSIMRIRKIAVDDIMQSMNISRAAFFKYKNGTRLPAKAEIVEEIADALHAGCGAFSDDSGRRVQH